MSPTARDWTSLAGRILMSVIFLMSGFAKITHWSETAGQMAGKGMPAVPVFLTAAILVEIFLGLGLLLGCGTRLSAALLFVYLIPTTLIFHNFWAVPADQQQMQMINFLKNL